MFCVKFRYKNGNEGVCTESGLMKVFENERDAAAFAKELNESIADTAKESFPVWFPVEVHDERNGATE